MCVSQHEVRGGLQTSQPSLPPPLVPLAQLPRFQEDPRLPRSVYSHQDPSPCFGAGALPMSVSLPSVFNARALAPTGAETSSMRVPYPGHQSHGGAPRTGLTATQSGNVPPVITQGSVASISMTEVAPSYSAAVTYPTSSTIASVLPPLGQVGGQNLGGMGSGLGHPWTQQMPIETGVAVTRIVTSDTVGAGSTFPAPHTATLTQLEDGGPPTSHTQLQAVVRGTEQPTSSGTTPEQPSGPRMPFCPVPVMGQIPQIPRFTGEGRTIGE